VQRREIEGKKDRVTVTDVRNGNRNVDARHCSGWEVNHDIVKCVFCSVSFQVFEQFISEVLVAGQGSRVVFGVAKHRCFFFGLAFLGIPWEGDRIR
jgi:hypothetical protein